MSLSKKEKVDIWRFVLPLIAMNALEFLIGRIALSFATRTSLAALSSVSAVDNFLYALAGIFGAFSVIFNIESAKANGEGNRPRLYQLMQSIFALNLKFGGIFLLLVIFFHRIFLQAVYGFSGELLNTASVYLLIQAPYLYLQISIFSFTGIMKIEKKTARILSISIFTSVLEIILSYFFIRVLGLGVKGAAVANMLLLTLQLLLYVFFTRHLLQKARHAKGNQQKLLLQKGWPIGLEEILEGTVFIIALDALAARMGLFAFSLYAILYRLIEIMKISTYVYGNAATVFVGEALGARKPAKIRQLLRYMLRIASTWYVTVGIALAIFSPWVLQLFTADEKLIAATLPYQLFIIVVAFPTTFYELAKYVLQTLEESRYVLYATAVVNLLVVSIIFVLALTQHLNLYTLFTAYSANFLGLSVLFIRKYRRLPALHS
ncbi:MATE family efflux transporter [Enterococcus nangangensis]